MLLAGIYKDGQLWIKEQRAFLLFFLLNAALKRFKLHDFCVFFKNLKLFLHRNFFKFKNWLYYRVKIQISVGEYSEA